MKNELLSLEKLVMAKMTLHWSPGSYTEEEVTDIGWLWTLRIYASNIIPLLLDEHGMPPFHLIPLLDKYRKEDAKAKSHDFTQIVKSELMILEKTQPSISGHVSQNIAWIAKRFCLNTLEIEILKFRYAYRTHQALEETLDSIAQKKWMGNLLYKILASALGTSPAKVELALSPKGKLCGSGLLHVNTVVDGNFGDKVSVFPGLITALNQPHKAAEDLLKFAITKVAKPTLSYQDYSHHADEVEVIKKHIANAAKFRQKGVNILIHGQPGVGKTELARLIASDLKLNAYEVPSGIESDGVRTLISGRIRPYVLLQSLLQYTNKGMVIFDEIEDVIPRPGLLDKPSNERKAWMNELIESNKIPTIWISNHVWQLDPALLRRFDIVLEIKNLPRSKRQQLLTESFQNLPVDAKWLAKLSNDPKLTPAVAKQTIKVIQNASISAQKSIQTYFDKQMEERRNALGSEEKQSYKADVEYRLDMLNTNIDMQELAVNLASRGSGRVLLYGPPGTGKTAFAHYLSRIADKPVMLKRGSDILSKWLGDTESNLSLIFNEAIREDSILLLDEADSFLQNRKKAERSWEVSQVNELLTQMESYDGMLICATNFMEHLDAAAMRRFPFKVRFDYLNQEQVEKEFLLSCNNLCRIVPDELLMLGISQKLSRLTNLTPGDFATVNEHFDLLCKNPNVEALIRELEITAELKDEQYARPIGFIRSNS